jgi:hypothetical protein
MQSWGLKAEIRNCKTLFYSKIIPIDANYAISVAGASQPDFISPTQKEPDYSIFVFDMKKLEVISKRKMTTYRNHCAVALYNKRKLYMIGGEFKG